MDKSISVVVSVYNEEKALDEFYRETSRVLEETGWDWELIFLLKTTCFISLVTKKTRVAIRKEPLLWFWKELLIWYPKHSKIFFD